MSDDITKEKHSRRLHKEESAIKRQVKIAKSHHVPDSQMAESHRYHKHHAMNCGNPQCVMCANPRKTFKEKTIQEKRFEQTEKWSED